MWWGGEPIWVTAERAGQPIGAAVLARIRSADRRHTAAILESRTTKACRAPRASTTYCEWLDLPGRRAPDASSRSTSRTPTPPGMTTGRTRRRCATRSLRVGRLSRPAHRRPGAARPARSASTSSSCRITACRRRARAASSSLDDYISLDDVEIVDINPTLGVFPKPGKEEAVYRALRQRASAPEGVPPRPDAGPLALSRSPAHPADRRRGGRRLAGDAAEQRSGTSSSGWCAAPAGSTATIRATMSMHGIFVAAGPAFRQGVTVPAFENVHIYNALAGSARRDAGEERRRPGGRAPRCCAVELSEADATRRPYSHVVVGDVQVAAIERVVGAADAEPAPPVRPSAMRCAPSFGAAVAVVEDVDEHVVALRRRP